MDQSVPSPPQALPDWLTEDYFRSLFRRKSPGEEVTVQKVTLNFADEERIHGKMVRAVVDVASPSGPSSNSYVAKAPGPGQFSTTPASANMYRMETLVLGEIVPAMERVLDAVSPGRFGQLAPRLMDYGLGKNHFIMTEDLTVQGFTTVPRQKGMDLEHSLAYAKHLGAFHGASVGILDRFESAITSIPLLTDSEESKNLNGFIETSLKGVVSVLESWEDGSSHVDKVRQLATTLPQRLAQANRRRESRLKVLCHGDMFVNNILFSHGESGNVTGVRVVDFQLSRVGSFADDLSGFLVSATSDEVLVDHWEEVVEAYRGTLNEVLHMLGLGGRSLSQDAVREELREQRAVAQFAAFHMLPHTRTPGAVNLQDGGGVFFLPAYQRLLRVLLPRFHALGWFDESEGSPEDSPIPASSFLNIRSFRTRDTRRRGSTEDIKSLSPLVREATESTTHWDTFRDVVETKSSLPVSWVKCLGGGVFQTTLLTIKALKMETPILGKSLPPSKETLKKDARECSTAFQFGNHGESRNVFSDTEDLLGQALKSRPRLKTLNIKYCLSFIKIIAIFCVVSLVLQSKIASKISHYPAFIYDNRAPSDNLKTDVPKCLVSYNVPAQSHEPKNFVGYVPNIQFDLMNPLTWYLSKNGSDAKNLQSKKHFPLEQNRTKLNHNFKVIHSGIAKSTDKFLRKKTYQNKLC